MIAESVFALIAYIVCCVLFVFAVWMHGYHTGRVREARDGECWLEEFGERMRSRNRVLTHNKLEGGGDNHE
jgi:hypothetical protein